MVSGMMDETKLSQAIQRREIAQQRLATGRVVGTDGNLLSVEVVDGYGVRIVSARNFTGRVIDLNTPVIVAVIGASVMAIAAE